MHLALMIFLALVAVFGTVGNIFIIGAVCLQKRLRVRGNAFVINLAVADLIVTAYIMPIGLATSQFKVSPFGATLCDVNAFLIITTCGVSTQSLMMIAIERYVHICKMKWYRKLFDSKMIVFDIAFCWVYTTLWTMHGWTGWTSFLYGEDVYVCLFDGTVSLSYDICLSVFGMVLPLLVLSVCYFNIFRTVRSTRAAINITRLKRKDLNNKEDPSVSEALKKTRKDSDREYRLILTLFAIVVVFCIMWTPAAFVLVLSGAWPSMPKVLYTFSVWLAFCNSSMNSVVYGIMNKNFRKGYRAMFKALFCTNHCKELDCWKHRTGTDSNGKIDTSSQAKSKQNSPDTSDTNVKQKGEFGSNTNLPRSPPTGRNNPISSGETIAINHVVENGTTQTDSISIDNDVTETRL